MNQNVILLERVFDAPVAEIWKAFTDKTEMKKWYFDLEEFKAEMGFKFTFLGGPDDGEKFMHLCEVTEVIAEKKLKYSWAYEGFPGISYVTFELTPQADKTLLKLTHTGIETFPQTGAFALANFREGWNAIINVSLKKYAEEA